MKLGLIIKSTSAGEQEVSSINKELEWAKFAADPRSIIKNLEGFDGSGKFVIIAKILGSFGYLLGVVKARPEGSGRPNDNTTAWIHVPATMQIPGEELCSVIEGVKKQLSAPLSINPTILNDLFAKNHEEKGIKDEYTALAFIGKYDPEGSIGWRDYGVGTGYALHELLGDSLAQFSYKKYKCICFVDKSLNLSTVGGETIKSGPKDPIMIKAPVDNKGFMAFIKTKNQEIPFNDAIEIPANIPLSIVWKKEGYVDIEKELKVEDNNPSSLAIEENERKFIFKRSWIKIRNRRYKNLDNAEVRVNDKLFTSDLMEISDAAIRDGVKIQVSHSGYKPKEVTKQISQNIEIVLDDKLCSKEYTLRTEDGKDLDSDAHIIVEMSNHYTGMPFKGYRSDHNGYIVYENNLMTKIKWFAIGVASVFVFGLLWAGYKALDSWTDNHKFQWGWPPIVKIEKTIIANQTLESDGTDNTLEVSPKTDIEKACEYLSTNSIWHKDSLAKFDVTQNLFEDMNSFNLKNLTQLESSELKNVELIKNLITASKLSIEKSIKPNIGKENNNGMYNSATEFGIDITNYISWIKEQHETVQKPKKSNATSNPSMNIGTKKAKADSNRNKTNNKRDCI